MNITIKRISAYIIDYIFIVLLITLISQIRFLKPNYDEYVSAYNDYYDYYEEILDNNISIIDSKEFKMTYYNLDKYSISISISSIIVYLLYFVGFQKWNNYQTLGKKVFNVLFSIVIVKKVFNIKISSKSNNISWGKLTIRSIILYNIFFEILSILALFIFKENNYLYVNIAISIIASIVFYINVFMIILSKKHLGLHDIICKTEIKEV